MLFEVVWGARVSVKARVGGVIVWSGLIMGES